MTASLQFIGHINTPYKSIGDCPNNIDFNGPQCQLILDEKFTAGLTGLSPGDKILVLYWFENTDRNELVTSADDGSAIGSFALRSPNRPNPIVAATLPIESIEDDIVTVRGLDCLDGTPLLDIKPAILLEI